MKADQLAAILTPAADALPPHPGGRQTPPAIDAHRAGREDGKMNEKPVPRRSWFAVWRWPRWVWGVVVPLLLVVYFLSSAPMSAILIFNRGRVPTEVIDAIDTYYAPVYWCVERSEALGTFFDWEFFKTLDFLRTTYDYFNLDDPDNTPYSAIPMDEPGYP